MCASEENSEFCFPESLNETKSKETLRLEGKQNSLFPEGAHYHTLSAIIVFHDVMTINQTFYSVNETFASSE